MRRTFWCGAAVAGSILAAVAAGPMMGATAALAAAHPAAARPAPAGLPDATLGNAAVLQSVPRHAPVSLVAPGLKICSFDGTRSRAPFATATGDLGYDQLRADLADPTKFGATGTVHRTIVIAPGVPTITAADLAGCNVFFTSVFTGALSGAEAAALGSAYRHGMRVITDADSDTDEQVSANSVVTALGRPAPFGGAVDCPADPAGGKVRARGSGDPAVFGPFGDLRGNTWGTTASAVVTIPNRTMAKCGGSVIRIVGAGKLFAGGDPSGFDLFTAPSGSFYNPTNEAAYLSFIGSAA